MALAALTMITFENPSQGSGSAKLWVIVDPVKDAFAHQYYCRNASDLQPFSPMSLSSIGHLEDADGARLFTTETGSFQIDVTIPGVKTVVGYGPPATPLPASWLATDQTEMQMTLTSFQPTDPKPLSC